MNANAEIIAELRRVLNERDEAREQLDLTKRELGRWVDREAKAVRERDEAIHRISEVGVMVATNGNLLAKEAYRRGAEAMREACAEACRPMLRSMVSRSELAETIRALPIPEEP